MSKLGKKPIVIPKDTKVKVENGKLTQTGPKGSKELSINDKIFTASVSEDNNLILNLIKKNEKSNIIWGTTRSILNLQLGFSHDCSYPIPQNVKVSVEKQTTIKISGIDKELVGKIASEIKMLKPVEPYKAKGIKEKGQYILRKEGKKKQMKIPLYKKRAKRIRNKLRKMNSTRFRLSIFRSAKNISAQIIDDQNNKTLVYASSIQNKKKEKIKKKDISNIIATELAKKAIEKKITKIYFDRGRYKYHGRIKVFADTLRKNGLSF